MSHTARAPLSRKVPFILAGCTAVSVLSTDLVTPSVPDLPDALGTDINTAQMVVSVNLFAYAVAQLIHGPVADRHGRRRLLLVAFATFAVVSVLCAMATSIEGLLAGRFAQGLFSSVPSVVIVLIIRELYDASEALKVMTLYGAAVGIAPALGPLMGGYLHVWFGWTAGFWLVAVLAIVAAWAVWRFIPESLGSPRPLGPRRAVRDYKALLRNPAFVRFSLAMSLAFGAFFAYVTTAPVVFIDILGLEPQQYGLTNVVIVAAFILGNLIAGQVRRWFGTMTLFSGAMAVALAAMLWLLWLIVSHGPSIWNILMPMALFAFALAFILAAGPLVALNAADEASQGPAAALLGSMQLAVSALAGSISALLFNGTALVMVLVMTASVAVGCYCTFFGLRRPRRTRAENGA